MTIFLIIQSFGLIVGNKLTDKEKLSMKSSYSTNSKQLTWHCNSASLITQLIFAFKIHSVLKTAQVHSRHLINICEMKEYSTEY